jgi:transposase
MFRTRAADLLRLTAVYVFGDRRECLPASFASVSRLAALASHCRPGVVFRNERKLKRMTKKVAAIDVGSEKMHVAIVGRQPRIFECFTDSLHALKDYLKAEGVRSVAMEATGVYWLPVYTILEEAGLEVVVVNGAHVKNVPGRKTDLQDCQWLAQLHAQGLLRGGFVPPAQIRQLRQYVRLRQDHVRSGSQHILHMQKALDLMNLKIHDVFSETVGVNCLRMIRAIVGGQRNPLALLELCDPDITRRKREPLLRALCGTWDAEHLFGLKQALAAWDFYQQQIAACDVEIQKSLQALAEQKPEPPAGEKPTLKKRRHNAPEMPGMETLLHRLTGADLSALPCLSAYSQMLILSEVGTDMSRWATAQHFVSWLGLAPGSRHSGKRRRNQKRFRGAAGKMFCVIARSLGRSKYLALAGFYRRLRSTRGGQVANIACARKIAILFYNALKHGLNYVEQGLETYEKKYREQAIKRMKRAAAHFGLTLVEPQLA